MMLSPDGGGAGGADSCVTVIELGAVPSEVVRSSPLGY